MSEYEAGYRACVAGGMIAVAVDRHFSGAETLDKSDDWFCGYQDATDDLDWRTQGVEQMQFGL